MARANPRYDRVNRYLKQEFPWQLDFYFIDTVNKKEIFLFYCKWLLNISLTDIAFYLIVNLNQVVTYSEMKDILENIKTKYTKLYLIYQYMWLSYQKRNNKAESLYCDSSTFKRNCDKMCKVILEYICQ